MSTVCITGVSGYIGSWVAKTFLEDGSFKVRGTVRDPKNEAKIKPLRTAFGDSLFSKLELVAADLLDADSLSKAIAGADIVVHTASPFPIADPKDEQEVIKPAVEGTLAVMRACHQHKVKRVVITSSCASIIYNKFENQPTDWKFTEEMWSDPVGNHINAYSKSKTKAEMAAWEFQKNLPKDEQFEIVTINPSLVLGPTMIPGTFSSGQIIANQLNGKVPLAPKVMFPVVDVRNVAQAHLQAARVPQAANNRYILTARSIWLRELGHILKSNYNQYGYKATDYEVSCYCVLWCLSFVATELQLILTLVGREWETVNTKSKQDLGIQYIDVQNSILEMAESLIEQGIIQDKKKAKK